MFLTSKFSLTFRLTTERHLLAETGLFLGRRLSLGMPLGQRTGPAWARPLPGPARCRSFKVKSLCLSGETCTFGLLRGWWLPHAYSSMASTPPGARFHCRYLDQIHP